MGQNIRVRVTLQSEGVRNLDPPEDKLAVPPETVRIVTNAGAL